MVLFFFDLTKSCLRLAFLRFQICFYFFSFESSKRSDIKMHLLDYFLLLNPLFPKTLFDFFIWWHCFIIKFFH